MSKNYYSILEIPLNSKHEEIKAAYRRLAKEFHPDRYGQKNSPFLTIQEAYSVLGDPVQRKMYDKIIQGGRQRREKPRNVEPMAGYRQNRVEPFIPEQEPPGQNDTSLTHSFFSSMPSFNSLFDLLSSNINEQNRPIDGMEKERTVIIVLTSGQASKGGHVRLQLPVRLRCSKCNGRGTIGPYECWRCSGAGLVRGECPVMVSYPPGIPDNSSIRLSLDRNGFYGRYLTVNFRIK
ncbi:MAG: DnaJ domain-containing protein [Desulfobacterium sp.]|jgi:DnaJ-class molecular chaperone|nr:DnaJ domain-containing protein [Desulfobacterium sp.]